MPGSRVPGAARVPKLGYYAVRVLLLAFLCVAVVFNVRALSGIPPEVSSAPLSASTTKAFAADPGPVAPVGNAAPRSQADKQGAAGPEPLQALAQDVNRQLQSVPSVDVPRPVVITPVKRTRVRVRRAAEDALAVSAPVTLPAAPQTSEPVAPSTMQAFISSGGNLPILVVTRTRTDVLRQTLSSLLSVRGVSREAIFVVQDGTDPDTAAVVHSFGLRLHQKLPGNEANLRGSPQDIGAERIATHFKYALEYMFDTVTDVRSVTTISLAACHLTLCLVFTAGAGRHHR